MSMRMFKTWGHKALVLGGLVLGLSQVGCAHPVAVSPSVVVSSQMGHWPVQAQIGFPVPVFQHQPRVIHAHPQIIYAPPPPPRVIYAPPVYRAAPVWVPGTQSRHGWGHDRRENSHADRRDDRRYDRRDGRKDRDERGERGERVERVERGQAHR